MSDTLLITIIGLAVIVLIAGIGMALTRSHRAMAEERLDELSGRKRAREDATAAMLLRPQGLDLGGDRSLLKNLVDVEELGKLYEQADVGVEFRHFLLIDAGLMVAGAVIGVVLKMPGPGVAVGAVFLGALPFFWLVLRKRKRLKQFVSQMPDALELVARALRAGHGLASGLNVVAEEMAPPIAQEFGRIFEEQNLGIPLEDALRGLAERVPTMDVRFFVTAVVIQRATGGDLAEILDKIGRLIRERFQILGQVQALTAEGRLSGVVLLALPPGLLAFLYMSNPEYVSLLFTTPIGTKLLAGAGFMQVLGAVAIKKIITIKV